VTPTEGDDSHVKKGSDRVGKTNVTNVRYAPAGIHGVSSGDEERRLLILRGISSRNTRTLLLGFIQQIPNAFPGKRSMPWHTPATDSLVADAPSSLSVLLVLFFFPNRSAVLGF
jgi:hypothetical protein